VKLIRGRQVLGEQAIGHYLEVKDEKTGETVVRRKLTGEINKSAYPAAWSEEQWIEANAALDSRKRGVRTGRNVTYWTNLFGDVAICADCGSRMAIRGNGKQAGQRYFGCSNAGASGCSNRRYYRVDLLEEKVLAWRGDVLEKDFDTKQDDREGLLEEIADTKAEARRLEKKYIEDNVNARTDLQKKALVAVHAKHEKELAKVRALEAKLTAVSKPVDVPATLRLMDRLRRMSGSKLIEARGKIAQRLPSIIEKMRFKPDGVEVDYGNGMRLTTLRDGNDFLEISERRRSMPSGIDTTLDRLTIRGGGMPDHTQRVGRLNRQRKT
jgi:recombinase-like zinc beta ribbon protein